MDQLLLRAVADEAAERLLEQEVWRVSHLGLSHYLLRFASQAREALLISVRPDLPRFHLLPQRGRAREAAPDRFALRLDQEIAGGVLEDLRVEEWDRIVRLRIRPPRREGAAPARILIAGLWGRAANLLLLDEEGLVLDAAHPGGEDRPGRAVGRPYAPPGGMERYAGLDQGPAALEQVPGRFASTGEFLRGLSPVLARDLERTAHGDARAESARVAAILAAAESRGWEPVVYSLRPLEELGDGDTLARDDLFVSPLPLGCAPHSSAGGPLIATRFASPSLAADAVFGLLERQRDFRALREHQEALIAREIGRLEALERKLREERRRAEECDRFRRMAEALLAGLGAARVDHGTARVPDPYDPAGAPIEVPVDPSRSLQENAQDLFGRYKKGKRAQRAIEARLPAVEARRLAWERLAAPAAAARGADDLDRLREDMGRLGLVQAPRPKKPGPPVAKRDEPARVRRHETADGLVILVGKSGAENDVLTFHVASPWDFWLHAAGQPGAHVVVRNPQRLASLPDATLRVAAEIAAYYSGARRDSKAEVHYTQRKHVHKRRGMPAGQVLLRRFRSLQVTPRLPFRTVEEV